MEKGWKTSKIKHGKQRKKITKSRLSIRPDGVMCRKSDLDGQFQMQIQVRDWDFCRPVTVRIRQYNGSKVNHEGKRNAWNGNSSMRDWICYGFLKADRSTSRKTTLKARRGMPSKPAPGKSARKRHQLLQLVKSKEEKKHWEKGYD